MMFSRKMFAKSFVKQRGSSLSFTPGFSRAVGVRRKGNRLNGFQILTFAKVTWLKPGENETAFLKLD